MINQLSFMGANFVARQNSYTQPGGWTWGEFDAQCNDFFRPLDTYRERIGALLDEVVGAGFSAMDLWTAHLHPLWATPEHVAILHEERKVRHLTLTSLAGGFGQSLPEFRATCRLASMLQIRILGGGTPLLATHRADMVESLREFGLIFALENHPEKTPAEVLQKLADGDADVMQVAVDTGWFATQGFDPPRALEELVARTALVHLKDVRAAGAHDTCGFGQGVAEIERCLEVLRAHGYEGPISIEHEPFDADPVPDCVAGLALVREALSRSKVENVGAEPIPVAILGCGNIADTYARQLASYPEARLVGVADLDTARARDFAARHGLTAYDSPDALLADPSSRVVVNLTIHHAHYDTIKACFAAGKHVHTEKPLALTSAQAWELVALADQAGLRLSSAPTTWMGEAQETARALVEDGHLGTPRVAYAEVNWGRIESWHPNPGPFYAVGPVFDVAVYPLTLLTSWFGPVRRVLAGGGILYPHRRTKEDVAFEVTSPDWSCAVLDFASGLRCRLTSSFYVSRVNSQAGVEVHGDLGSLRLGQFDTFNSSLEFGKFSQPMRPVVLPRAPYQGVEFARGCRDLLQAIQEDRPHRCTGAQAAHVVEICEAILQSLQVAAAREVHSDFPLPAPSAWTATHRPFIPA